MSDRPPIGPTRKYDYGHPMYQGDRGGLNAGFYVLPEIGQCVLEFGTSLNNVALPPAAAKDMARAMRDKVTQAFGTLSYNKSELPIQVTADFKTGLIQVTFPFHVGTLAANPHVFLALAERMEEEAAKFPNLKGT